MKLTFKISNQLEIEKHIASYVSDAATQTGKLAALGVPIPHALPARRRSCSSEPATAPAPVSGSSLPAAPPSARGVPVTGRAAVGARCSGDGDDHPFTSKQFDREREKILLLIRELESSHQPAAAPPAYQQHVARRAAPPPPQANSAAVVHHVHHQQPLVYSAGAMPAGTPTGRGSAVRGPPPPDAGSASKNKAKGFGGGFGAMLMGGLEAGMEAIGLG